MKTVAMERADLKTCVANAKRGRVIVTRDGSPAALIVNIEGLDEEQLQLGSDDKFWKLIQRRRKEKT